MAFGGLTQALMYFDHAAGTTAPRSTRNLALNGTPANGIQGTVDQIKVSELHVGTGSQLLLKNADDTATLATFANTGAHSFGIGGQIITLLGSLTVTENFVVSGDTVTQSVGTLIIEDPLIELGSGNAANIVDLGFYANYNDGAARFAGLYRDATDAKFKLFFGTQTEPTTTVDTGAAGYDHADLQLGSLTVDDNTALGSATTNTVAFTARVGPAATPDVNFVKEVAHTLAIDTSTTDATAGGAFTFRAGQGAVGAAGTTGGAPTVGSTGSVGGTNTLQGGTGGTGGVGGTHTGLNSTGAAGGVGGAGVAALIVGGVGGVGGAGGGSTGTAANSNGGAGGASGGVDIRGGVGGTGGAAGTGGSGAAGAAGAAGTSGDITIGATATRGIGIGVAAPTTTGQITITAGAASTWSTSTGGLTLTSAAAATWSTAAGGLTLTSADAATWSTAANALTLQGATTLLLNAGGATLVATVNSTDITMAANKNFAAAAGTGAFSWGSATGNFAFPTGAISYVGAATKSISLVTTGAGSSITLTAGAASTWSTSAGGLTITSAEAATWSVTTGTLTLNASTGLALQYGGVTVLKTVAVGTARGGQVVVGGLTTTALTAAGEVAAMGAAADYTPVLAQANAIGTSRFFGVYDSVAGQVVTGAGSIVQMKLENSAAAVVRGDPIYLSSGAAGRVTKTAPTASGTIVAPLGIAMKSVAAPGGTGDLVEVLIGVLTPIIN